MRTPEAPQWRKSRHSNPSGNCVEIAVLATERIGVRNSRNPDAATLAFPGALFRALVIAVVDGTFEAGNDTIRQATVIGCADGGSGARLA